MSQQTLGQRIAAQRKKQGLSQEALGEKMGVSRQAISKWESDGAVPEIDKLIAMSKLFRVSLGWLLGVEEEAPAQSATLSEEQLKLIEQIIQKYQQPPAARHARLPVLLAAGALALSLALSVAALVKSGDTSAVSSLQGQLAHLTTNYSNLQNNIAYLSSQLSQMAEGDRLLMEYSFSAAALEDLSGAKVTFTAIPNTWQDGDAGFLSVRRGGSEVVRANCVWDGTGCAAEAAVPAENDYEYYFIHRHADGTQEQQKLDPEDHYVVHIADGMRFDHHIFFSTYADCTTTMQLFAYDAFLYAPALVDPDGLRWEQADLVFLLNGQELHRSSILTAEESAGITDDPTVSFVAPAERVDTAAASVDIEKNHVELQLAPDLKPGDSIEAKLVLKLNNGMAHEEILDSWPIG